MSHINHPERIYLIPIPEPIPLPREEPTILPEKEPAKREPEKVPV